MLAYLQPLFCLYQLRLRRISRCYSSPRDILRLGMDGTGLQSSCGTADRDGKTRTDTQRTDTRQTSSPGLAGDGHRVVEKKEYKCSD